MAQEEKRVCDWLSDMKIKNLDGAERDKMTEKEKACLSTALNAGSDRRGVDTTGLAQGNFAAAIQKHRKHKVARPMHDENKKQQTTGTSLTKGA